MWFPRPYLVVGRRRRQGSASVCALPVGGHGKQSDDNHAQDQMSHFDNIVHLGNDRVTAWLMAGVGTAIGGQHGFEPLLHRLDGIERLHRLVEVR